MKIFIDTANLEAIKKYSFIIDGVTTNPTLVAKENCNFNELIGSITQIVKGPINVEAVTVKSESLIEEAKKLSEISPNIVVKIPMTDEGLKATKELSTSEIKTNVTLIFSANQALMAAKAGATYVSPFIGRLDDIGHEGLNVVKDILEIYRMYNYSTNVITASIRHPMHVINAAKIGTHVATIPPNVLELMFKHKLTDAGLDRFLEDWKLVKGGLYE
jgi:transaldolase